ncbi:ComF family protein [Paenibacillus sp. KN14-4R]|uniref:ComF family protein n=1 Tax=Paenibacillus sp. KN14-4R TaxID=3445773 RepID=UPI003F9F2166
MNRSAVQYNQEMREILARYKYRGDEQLCGPMSDMLCYAYALIQQAAPSPPQTKEVLTYVPVSQARFAERGFNQAEQMARSLGKKLSMPVIPLLQRNRHTEKQSLKSRNERLLDLQHVFSFDRQGKDQLELLNSNHPYRIYIVDDVYTTGSTLQQCATIIHESVPFVTVYGLTWAR